MSQAGQEHSPRRRGNAAATDVTLVEFLVARLTEDLAHLWQRNEEQSTRTDRPGLPAQVAIVDELLVTLRTGALPSRRELRMLLYGYGSHPDYDPAWTHQLSHAR